MCLHHIGKILYKRLMRNCKIIDEERECLQDEIAITALLAPRMFCEMNGKEDEMFPVEFACEQFIRERNKKQ